MDTNRFNEEHAAKSRAVCERIEREDAERRSKLGDLMGDLGRARAESDGWRKIAERRLGHIDECESALAKRNERISKLEKQVGYLRAELANAEVLSGRERKILDMWPRFEGTEEPVMIGDEVDGLGGEIVEVYITEDAVAIWNNAANHMHLMPGERVKRPAPADSWKRLEEDAKKGVCEYAGAYRKHGTIDSHECDGCRFDDDGNGPTCEQQMALDIIRRAKALVDAEVE